ncbi:hypothetical protein ANN_05380 [Periplaneta americana]|uniref:Uncharacterized protein n=1 Tax=Periplaneta americana TaxID=6978 RepID=A0ABQ8TD01_PERAM|nr:hypothetical protein ANN_05380 [Periplaneta americana]
MSEGGVRQWCRMFKNGRTNIHDEERRGRPSIVNADLIRLVDERVRANRRFTMSELSEDFPQISRILLYKVITEDLGYNLCNVGRKEGRKEGRKGRRRIKNIGQGAPLKSQAREMVCYVREYFDREKDNGGSLLPLAQVAMRTAACGFSGRLGPSKIHINENYKDLSPVKREAKSVQDNEIVPDTEQGLLCSGNAHPGNQ